MRIAAALIVVGGLVSSISSNGDQPLTRTFNNIRHGFSISLPTNWVEMPREKLESINHAAEALHPEWKRPLLQYGYQMTESEGLAFPPYVIIRVTDTGHAPDLKVAQEDLADSGDLPEGVQRGVPTFDRDLNAFLQTNQVNVEGIPPMEISVAYFLTTRGAIKMFFYAPLVGSEETFVPVQQIIRNVRIREALTNLDPAPASRIGLMVALLSMGMIVLTLFRAKSAKRP
jgi:hypothetical protein